MKEYTIAEIKLLMINMSLESEKCNKRKINVLYSRLEEVENLLLSNYNNFIKLVDNLMLDSSNYVIFYTSCWCFDTKYRVADAKNKLFELLKDNELTPIFRANVFMTFEVANGKYGGWKRDERYPDLSEYEDKLIDK